MAKTFYFEFTTTFRDGDILYFFDSDELSETEKTEYFEVDLETNKNTSYIVYLDENYDTVKIEFDNDTIIEKYGGYKTFDDKVFSLVYNSLPFVVTSGSNKIVKGYYPEISKEILNIPDIPELKSVRDGKFRFFRIDVKDDGSYCEYRM